MAISTPLVIACLLAFCFATTSGWVDSSSPSAVDRRERELSSRFERRIKINERESAIGERSQSSRREDLRRDERTDQLRRAQSEQLSGSRFRQIRDDRRDDMNYRRASFVDREREFSGRRQDERRESQIREESRRRATSDDIGDRRRAQSDTTRARVTDRRERNAADRRLESRRLEVGADRRDSRVDRREDDGRRQERLLRNREVRSAERRQDARSFDDDRRRERLVRSKDASTGDRREREDVHRRTSADGRRQERQVRSQEDRSSRREGSRSAEDGRRQQRLLQSRDDGRRMGESSRREESRREETRREESRRGESRREESHRREATDRRTSETGGDRRRSQGELSPAADVRRAARREVREVMDNKFMMRTSELSPFREKSVSRKDFLGNYMSATELPKVEGSQVWWDLGKGALTGIVGLSLYAFKPAKAVY